MCRLLLSMAADYGNGLCVQHAVEGALQNVFPVARRVRERGLDVHAEKTLAAGTLAYRSHQIIEGFELPASQQDLAEIQHGFAPGAAEPAGAGTPATRSL